MAVQTFQRKPEKTGSRGSKGGSKFGTLAGAAVGAAVTGGSLAGASAGASLGGTVGGMVDPAKADTRQAIQRRVSGLQPSAGAQTPDAQAQIRDAIFALKEINDRELPRTYAPVLTQGMIQGLNDRGTA
jgi:phage tail tape-measure protein